MSFWDFAKRREEGKGGTESADHGLHSIKVLKPLPYVDGSPQRELERERAKFLEIRVRPRNIRHIRQWSSENKTMELRAYTQESSFATCQKKTKKKKRKH